MADIRISALPTAPSAITGAELVPIVQNGLTVQTTVSAITQSPNQTQPFLTVSQQPTLPNSRYFAAGVGLGITDGGAQGAYTIAFNGTAASLEASGTGFVVKTAANTITPRSFAIANNGLSLSNGDGVAGNPTLSLSGLPLALANTSGTGLMAINGSTLSPVTLTGTTDQISILNGNGVGTPTVGIATNPTIPGTGAVKVPSGTSALRPSVGSNSMFRYNETLGLFEGYANSSWSQFAMNSGGSIGVTSIVTGTGLTGGPITTTGTISIANTGVTAGTYGSSALVPVLQINAQGQITSVSQQATNAPAYQGTWNASTNVPALTSSVGTAGYYYVVATAGNTNLNGVTGWNVGDWAIFSNGVWQKLPGSASESFTNLTTTNLAVTGLTGYMYANGSGNVTASTVIAVANGGTGVTASSGATSVVLRDANANITANSYFEGFSNVAAAGTVTTLTVSSVPNWVVTGSGGQTFQLPDATTLPAGAEFFFNNNQSSGTVVVRNNSGTTVVTLQSGAYVTVSLLINSPAAGSWDAHYQAPANVSWSTNTFDYAGSITSATWNGNVVQYNRGGTGQSSYATGDMIYASGVNTLAKLTAGTNGYVLTLAAGVPTWAASTGGVTSFSAGTTGLTPSTGTTGAVTLAGTLAIANGGTNSAATPTAGGIGYGTGTAHAYTAVGTSGQVLQSNAAGVPTWVTPAGGVTLSNDTATSTNLYPTFANATSGSVSTIYTGNARLLYKPSTGELQSTVLNASNGIVVNSATVNENYTIPSGSNAMSAGPITVASGIVVTVPSGSTWVIS